MAASNSEVDQASTASAQDLDGKAQRAQITAEARQTAAEALKLVDAALEADGVVDEAALATAQAERTGDRAKMREARQAERAARKQSAQAHAQASKSARRAYNAIRFSAPNKLGVMRVVMVLLALHIALQLMMLVLSSRDAYSYNALTILGWLHVIAEGIAFWMFVNRFKLARPFVIAMSVINILVDVLVMARSQSFRLLLFVTDDLFYFFLIFYFAFSDRVKYTLVNDLSTYRPAARGQGVMARRWSWEFIRNLGMYFVVFSVLGHWMEMAMCQLIIAGLVEGEYDPTNTMLWRDWLYPFPMEGMAVVIIAIVLYPLYQRLLQRMPNKIAAHALSFTANALTCSAIEFGMGLIVNSNHELWDYSENFGNIMGQVCLQNALAFGMAASIITWFVYPALERWIARMPSDYMNLLFVIVLVFGGIIWSLYIIEAPEIQSAQYEHGPISVTVTGEDDLENSNVRDDDLHFDGSITVE